jgi:hypothetical protein
MTWGLILKLQKFSVKVIVFRPNLPAYVDYAKRIKGERYILRSTKHHIPSPPGNEYMQYFDKKFHLFLYSPRIGTYIYLKPPATEYNAESNILTVNYRIRNELHTEQVNTEVVDDNGIKQVVAMPNKEVRLANDIELFDHDDKNFLIEDIELSNNKYPDEVSWFEKHGTALMLVIFMIGVSIGLFIVYQQIVFPSAQYAIRPGMNVVCNYTGNFTNQGVIL